RAVSFGTGACLCANRIETNATEGTPADSRLREDHHAEVLRGLSPAGLHLRQNLLRTDRCASVCAGPGGDAGTGTRNGRGDSLPAGSRAEPQGNVRASAQGRSLLLGRDLHTAGKFVSCLSAQRRGALSRYGEAVHRRRKLVYAAFRKRERVARSTRIQPSELALLGDAVILQPERSEVSAGRPQRLPHDRGAELCHRRLGAE